MATLEKYSDVIQRLKITSLEDRVAQSEMFPPDFAQPNWLPCQDHMLSPALFALNWNLLTPEVQSFVKDVKHCSRIDILFQAPGEGKTCRLLGLTNKMYVVYITCTSLNAVPSFELFYDFLFQKFLYNTSTLDLFDAVSTITKEVGIYYLARFVHLLLCLTKRDTVPSTIDYWQLQQNGNAHVTAEIYSDVRTTLLPYSEDVVRRLLGYLIWEINNTSPKRIALCIDKSNVAAAQDTKRYV
jgi:hypothetical protein